MTDQSDSHGAAALQINFPSREAFLDDYDRQFAQGRAAVQVDKALPAGERVELRVNFPGLRVVLRLRGLVGGVESPEGERRRLRLELTTHGAAWARLQLQVEQIRNNDPALVAPVLRVLLVEDNPHVARLIREGLEAYVRRSGQVQDFAISLAVNGKDALDQLTAGPCDLLLSDVYLPLIDGENLFRMIRGGDKHPRLPIVAFSAGGDDARERALAGGADCFLEKPVRLEELLRALRQVLEERGAR